VSGCPDGFLVHPPPPSCCSHCARPIGNACPSASSFRASVFVDQRDGRSRARTTPVFFLRSGLALDAGAALASRRVAIDLELQATCTRTAPALPLSQHVPLMAAVLCAVSPLVNLLGASAQQETLFSLLVLGTVWSIERRRFMLSGALLAFAAMIRYEAWGAVAMLVAAYAIGRIPPLSKRLPAPMPVRQQCHG
jgi:hypothetical protein